MTPEEFVTALHRLAVGATVDGVVAKLEAPPGRRPSTELVELAAWYRDNLLDLDREYIRRLARLVAHDAVFSVLAVIDGVTAIEGSGEKGTLKLSFHKQGQAWELNPERGEMLHDLLNEVAAVSQPSTRRS